MRLEEIRIRNYRSIGDVTIKFPPDKPVILFGQNNAGKSNILHAINMFLGENFPLYQDISDSDYRRGSKDPIDIIGTFDESVSRVRPFLPQPWDTSKHSMAGSEKILMSIPMHNTNSLYHNGLPTNNIDIRKIGLRYQKYMLSNSETLYPERYFYPPDYPQLRCDIEENAWRNYSSLLITPDGGLRSVLDYENKNSIVRRLFAKIFDGYDRLDVLKEKLDEAKEELPEAIGIIIRDLIAMANNSIDGFSTLDFSLYDPAELSAAIHFVIKDGCESIYGIGEGQQQVLALSLLIEYAKVAGGFRVLMMDEPETHLHPLAQKWLREYIKTRSANPIDDRGDKLQFIIATHSPYFLDSDFIEGFVHVYKENGVTRTKQPMLEGLREAIPKMTIKELSNYFCTVFTDKQLKGFFSKIILLVEGESEAEALPIYFKNQDFPLYRKGISIISCDTKKNIMKFYKIFNAYGYKCYTIFDYDDGNPNEKSDDEKLIKTFQGDWPLKGENQKPYDIQESYAFFMNDFDIYIHECLTAKLGKERYNTIKKKLTATYGFNKGQQNWRCEDKKKLPSPKPQFERAWAIYIIRNEPEVIVPFVEDIKLQLEKLATQ